MIAPYDIEHLNKETGDRPFTQLLSAHAFGAGGLRFKFRVGQIDADQFR